MKKIVIKSDVKRIIIALLFLIFIMSSASAAAIITIGDGDIVSETNVTVPLMINDVEDVVSATINVTYNASVLVITDVGDSDFESFTPNLWFAEQGWVKMNGYTTGEKSGNVKFAALTITPTGSHGESSELTIEVLTLSDSNKNKIDAEVKNRLFSIGESSDGSGSGTDGNSGGSEPAPSASPATSPTPTPSVKETITPTLSPSPPKELTIVTVQVGDVTAGKADFVNTRIMIKGVKGEEGLSAARINLTYSPGVVQVISAENSDFDMFIPNIVDGKVRMVAYQTSAEGKKGDIIFADLKLKAVGTNEGCELGLEVAELTDNKGFPVRFEVEKGYFSVEGGGEEEGGEETVSEAPSEPVIPALSAAEVIAVIAGLYFGMRQKRRR